MRKKQKEIDLKKEARSVNCLLFFTSPFVDNVTAPGTLQLLLPLVSKFSPQLSCFLSFRLLYTVHDGFWQLILQTWVTETHHKKESERSLHSP